MANHLVVIYGAPLSGKSTVAWRLARSLGAPSVVVSVDQLLGGTIAVSAADPLAELEMVHTQLRLLVVNYLKNRYHVVVEGPFSFEVAGAVHSFEAEIDQLVALMRHLTDRALIVRLDAAAATLTSRAEASSRTAELAAALRVTASYRQREGERFRSFDTEIQDADAIADKICEALADTEPPA